jgi:hypothetical protein
MALSRADLAEWLEPFMLLLLDRELERLLSEKENDGEDN